MVQFESTIERDYLYLLDYEADITHFEEQPLAIEYRHEGKLQHYTPDFHVVQSAKNVLAECKPALLVDAEDNPIKFMVADLYCGERGWTFRVVTDAEIRSGWRLANVKTLRRYACLNIRPELEGRIYALLYDSLTQWTVAQIHASIGGDPAATSAAVFRMAYHHKLEIPLDDSPITANSPVCLNNHKGGRP